MTVPRCISTSTLDRSPRQYVTDVRTERMRVYERHRVQLGKHWLVSRYPNIEVIAEFLSCTHERGSEVISRVEDLAGDATDFQKRPDLSVLLRLQRSARKVKDTYRAQEIICDKHSESLIKR